MSSVGKEPTTAYAATVKLRAELLMRGINFWSDPLYPDRDTSWYDGDRMLSTFDHGDGTLYTTISRRLTPDQVMAEITGEPSREMAHYEAIKRVRELAKLARCLYYCAGDNDCDECEMNGARMRVVIGDATHCDGIDELMRKHGLCDGELKACGNCANAELHGFPKHDIPGWVGTISTVCGLRRTHTSNGKACDDFDPGIPTKVRDDVDEF